MAKYIAPEVEFELYSPEDIIASSGENPEEILKDPYVSDKW